MASVILNMPKILNILGVFALLPFEYDIYVIKVYSYKSIFIYGWDVEPLKGKMNEVKICNLDFILIKLKLKLYKT